ncbi:hypothetical protein GOP47_0017410 [Adiantum capillus-veneris]|uniref:Uncharacterized protein n=1 Tax=Adiantum capillus-veneris TaxID=13818 RepID=A0A9D4UFT0_ADICA|nr:hypothetical protein GOP47_0017410 [Adiantum capillus-veneris]
MAWLRRLVSPLLRIWSISIGRLRGERRGCAGESRSLMGAKQLYHQVQSCKYEDVHVMWSMLAQQPDRLRS